MLPVRKPKPKTQIVFMRPLDAWRKVARAIPWCGFALHDAPGEFVERDHIGQCRVMADKPIDVFAAIDQPIILAQQLHAPIFGARAAQLWNMVACCRPRGDVRQAQAADEGAQGVGIHAIIDGIRNIPSIGLFSGRRNLHDAHPSTMPQDFACRLLHGLDARLFCLRQQRLFRLGGCEFFRRWRGHLFQPC